MYKKLVCYFLVFSMIFQVGLTTTIYAANNELKPGEIMVNDSELTFAGGDYGQTSDGWFYSEHRKDELNLPLLDVYEGDIHAMNFAGATVSYSFEGSHLSLFGETNSDGGTATLKLFKADEDTASYTESISFVSDSRLGFQEVLNIDIEEAKYNLVLTIDGTGWVGIDAIRYTDTSNLVKDLTVVGLTELDTDGSRGTYTIVSEGSQTGLMESQLVNVVLNNSVNIPEGDVITLKNGEVELATATVTSIGDITLSFVMPAENVQLSAVIRSIDVTPVDVWVEDALSKVESTKVKPSLAVTEISLESAKNDYEGSQIVLKDNREFDITEITFDDLTTAAGQMISKDNFQFNFVDYKALSPVSESVKGPVLENGSNGNISEIYRPEQLYPKGFGSTILPDPLSNDTSRTVTSTQPILVTIYVPSDAQAGEYTSNVKISTSIEEITVPVHVTVYDVLIPEISKSEYTIYNWASELGYSFQFTLDSPKVYYGIDERYTDEWWTVIDSWTDEMIEHRQNMYLLNTPQLLIDGGTTIAEDGTVTFNWSRFDEFINKLIDKGFRQFGGMHLMFHWNGIDPLGYAGQGRGRSGILERDGADDNLVYRGYYADDSRTTAYYEQYFAALAEHLDTLYIDESTGVTVLDQWYQHVFDEPKYAPSGGADWKIIAELVKEYGIIKDDTGDIIKKMKTSDADASGILKSNPELVDRWVPDLRDYANDKDFYDNLIAEGKDVTFYVCVSPPAPYLNRFTTQDNIAGLLLSWYAEENHINNILHWGFNTWSYSEKTTPGDAQIVYPDKENLSLKKSLRFEAMRDGIEDYELLSIVRENEPLIADRLIKNLITNAREYTTDIKQYRNIRQKLLRIASGETGVEVPIPEDLSVVNGMYNNDHETMSYTGNWEEDSNRTYGDYKADAKFTSAQGSYVEFSFEGTGVQFFTEKNNDMGEYDVFIDDIKVATVSSYTAGSREAAVVTFEKKDLQLGSHIIKIINNDEGKYMLVDAFKVLTEDVQPTDITLELTGASEITSNSTELLILKVNGLNNTTPLYGLMATITYDQKVVKLQEALSLNDALQIVSTNVEEGLLKVFLASTEINGLTENDDIMSLEFIAIGEVDESSDVIIKQIEYTTGVSQEATLVNLTHTLAIVNIYDVNGDGVVSISDIVLISQNYGKTSEDENWETIHFADINRDSEIGLEDLVSIAQELMKH